MAQYQGKHGRAPARRGNGRRIALLCVALVLVASIGGTLAYIAVRADEVENTFEPAYVTSEVVVKNDTQAVKNTGNVDAFIRAAIVVNWMDENGNVRGLSPQAGEYSMTVNESDWNLNADGYYYYKYKVASMAVTENLVTDIRCNSTPPDGYSLAVEVAAEAIQAAGDTDDTSVPAYKDAWGITFTLPHGGGA